MTYTEKIDVLDLLINIIREHEAKLEILVSRLEGVSMEPHEPHDDDDDEQRRRFYAPL